MNSRSTSRSRPSSVGISPVPTKEASPQHARHKFSLSSTPQDCEKQLSSILVPTVSSACQLVINPNVHGSNANNGSSPTQSSHDGNANACSCSTNQLIDRPTDRMTDLRTGFVSTTRRSNPRDSRFPWAVGLCGWVGQQQQPRQKQRYSISVERSNGMYVDCMGVVALPPKFGFCGCNFLHWLDN